MFPSNDVTIEIFGINNILSFNIQNYHLVLFRVWFDNRRSERMNSDIKGLIDVADKC